MKKLALVALMLILIPAITHAIESNEPGPQITSSTPRQFIQNTVLSGAGSAELTIVATAGDEGRAMSAMSRTLGQASGKAGALIAEVAKVNAAPRKQPVAISNELFTILDRCKQFSSLTESAFDITGAAKTEGFSQYFFAPNWRKLKLNKKKQTLTIKSKQLEIDPRTFGIVLRGFLADDVIASLTKQGWKNAQIKISNVTRSVGRDIHTAWRIRLDAPTAAERGKYAFRAYDYSVGNVATAMISPRLFPQGIVDPRTRTLVDKPAVINTLVFANDAATATAYAIATYAKSAVDAQRGMNFITGHSEAKAIVIAADGTVLSSKGMVTKADYAKTKKVEVTTETKESTKSQAPSTK